MATDLDFSEAFEPTAYSTALDLDDNGPTVMSALGILLDLILCGITLYDVYHRSFVCSGYYHPSSWFPFNYIPVTQFNSFRASYVSNYYLRRLAGIIFGPTPYWTDILLSILKGGVFSSILTFMIHGIAPFDSFIEYLLSGGSFLINAQFLPGGRVYLLHRYFSVLCTTFQSYLGLAFLPAVQSWLSHDNIAFLAPLSWMLVAYVSIYMTSRRASNNIKTCAKRHPYSAHLRANALAPAFARLSSYKNNLHTKNKPSRKNKARNHHYKKKILQPS